MKKIDYATYYNGTISNPEKINFTEQFQRTCAQCCNLNYILRDKANVFPFYVIKYLIR